jgi:hypothetical protein
MEEARTMCEHRKGSEFTAPAEETSEAESRRLHALVESACNSEATRMGWGKCSVSGCPWPAYQQTYGSELCANCGHKYTDHW